MAATEIATIPQAISILNSMYLCMPSPDAIENWKCALADDVSIFLAELKAAVGKIDSSSDSNVEEFSWDYTRLFIGPYKLPCPPWESVYTHPKRLMMQDAAVEVGELYKRAGLEVNTASVMPDDIGAELNFFSLLLQRIHEKDTPEEHITVAEEFLHKHLMRWIPQFTRDMEAASDTELYRTVARTTRAPIEILGSKKFGSSRIMVQIIISDKAWQGMPS